MLKPLHSMGTVTTGGTVENQIKNNHQPVSWTAILGGKRKVVHTVAPINHLTAYKRGLSVSQLL